MLAFVLKPPREGAAFSQREFDTLQFFHSYNYRKNVKVITFNF